jgi:hypothetical protein
MGIFSDFLNTASNFLDSLNSDSDDSSDSFTFSNDTWPTVNIDGSPMLGGVDIHGHPFGVTDSDSSAFSSDDFGCDSSSDDSFMSSSSFDTCDSFSSFSDDSFSCDTSSSFSCFDD